MPQKPKGRPGYLRSGFAKGKAVVSDIASGARQLADQAKAAASNIRSGYQKIKAATR